MLFTSVIRDKTFVVYECNKNIINIYVGELGTDNLPVDAITLDSDILDEKDFHQEITYWSFENP